MQALSRAQLKNTVAHKSQAMYQFPVQYLVYIVSATAFEGQV